jgi:glycosyltransferase involved in cell wall biosynthesis
LKKILYIHASAELYGSDRILLELILSLDRTHFYPIVILPFHGPLAEEFQKQNIEYKIVKIPVLRRDLFNLRGILQYSLRTVVSFVRLAFLVVADRISIIHTNTSAVVIGGFVAFVTGRKHVWQIMEIVEKPYLLGYLIAKTVSIFSSQVFCISDAVRTHFLKFNSEKRSSKFITLYHGVDPTIYQYSLAYRDRMRHKLGVAQECIVVGFIGRLNAWKGQDIFCKAAEKCITQSNDLNLHFLIIGSCFQGQDRFRIALETEISKNDRLKANISLYGFQHNINEWLSAIDIFTLPSKLPEPNATIVLAAMATQLPVIGTNIGGTIETIIENETGLLIAPNDADALCEKILFLASNKDLRNKMGRNGLNRVKTVFSLENYNLTVQKAYE